MSTYYVSQLSGSDSYSSTQALTASTPWKTISHAYYQFGNTTTPHTLVINDSSVYHATRSLTPAENTTNDSNQIIAGDYHIVRNLTIATGSEPDGTGCEVIFDGGDEEVASPARFAFKFYEDRPDDYWTIEDRIRFRNFPGPDDGIYSAGELRVIPRPYVYYVSQASGSDSNTGDQAQYPETPWKTISHAYYKLGNSTTGSTFIINDSETYHVTQSSAPGAGATNDTNQIIATTHHLVSNLVIATGSFTDAVTGITSGCTPIFDGGLDEVASPAQFAFKFYENDPSRGWLIRGIRFQNFKGPNEYHAPVMQTVSTKVVHVEDCSFFHCSGSGIYCEARNGSITRCQFEDIEDHGIHMANPAPLSGDDTLITNCLFIGGAHGLSAIKGNLAGGTALHNTIYESGQDARVSALNRSYAYAVFCNVAKYNILLNCCQSDSGLRATTHAYNCISGTEKNATAGGGLAEDYYDGTLGTGDLEATDPLFVNLGSITGSGDNAGNFRLQKTSPARGLAGGSTLIDDLPRDSRLWRFKHAVLGYTSSYSVATPDAGCYEYTFTSIHGIDTKNIAKVNGVG